MVYGVVQRHNASIEIDSAPGRGTTISLLFPLPVTEVLLPAVADLGPRPRAPLHLLVIDDDAVLLRSLCQTLQHDGHTVVACGGGRAGIDAFLAARLAGQPFAAVITDLGMPQVDGAQVAREIKAVSPATAVFLLTGWGQHPEVESGALAPFDRVLNKPPKLRELREALATLDVAG
jgi:CheY-like chemotaxis protein